MTTVTVYTRPGCAACGATIRLLNAQGVPIAEIVDVSVDEEAREYLMALGHTSLPVVIAGERHWSGYRDDAIRNLAKAA